MRKEKDTICWNCANFAKCSWCYGIPVEGWDATPTIITNHLRGQWEYKVESYIVNSCPQFEEDRVIRVTIKDLAKLLGLNMRTLYRRFHNPIFNKFLNETLKNKGYILKIGNEEGRTAYFLEKIKK